MKKLKWLGVLFAATMLLAACGQEEKKEETKKEEVKTEEAATETTSATEETKAMAEPTAESMCEYCNMVVYTKEDPMGVFSAQGINEAGESLFFDDIGCMLNQEKVDETTYEKYVRDYYTAEWVKLEEALIVKAEIETPMHYGFAFFKDQASADAFIKEQGADTATISNLSAIDEEAGHRHMMRMEKMQNGGGHGMSGNSSSTSK